MTGGAGAAHQHSMTSSETAAALVHEAERLASEGRPVEAALAYQRVLARWPDLPDCWYNLGLLQRRLGQFEAALDSYAQALQRGVSRQEEVHLNRGVIFADCLRQDAAAEHELRAALRLNPTYVPALQNLANLCEDRGQRADAGALYQRILALEPHAFEALARYAQLAESTDPHEPLIARLRAALAHPAASAADQASLGFALARRLEVAGAYPQAFAAAAAANRASKLSSGAAAHYDRRAHERLIDALIAAFPCARALRRSAAAGAAPASAATVPAPIFICGMFRSGSTLTERILAGHPQVTAGGELDLLPQLAQSALAPFPASMASASTATLTNLAAQYLQRITQLFPGARCVTDKRPDNFLLIGLIKTLFPQASIVHTTRDALDNCLSIFFLHLDQRLPWALDLMDIGHYLQQYRRLMRHWQTLYRDDILELNYDDLVRDGRAVAQRLLTSCGLDWDQGCLDFASRTGSVKTASVWQVRDPLYQSSSGRARHYSRELAGLAAYLTDPH